MCPRDELEAVKFSEPLASCAQSMAAAANTEACVVMLAAMTLAAMVDNQ